VFVLGETFQISLMFASNAGAYSSGAPLKNSTLILFYYTYPKTRLERLDRDKHSSLLQKSVNYGQKKVL
jgi:hypothetical protein